MRFLPFFPFFRARQAKTIKIRRVLPAQRALFIKFHIAAALTLLGLLAGVSLLGLACGATVLSEPGTIANPTLLAALLSAHTCAVMFALNRNAH
jgi:hypothetical protein